MTAMGAPFGGAGRRPRQLPGIDRPAGEFGRVVDSDVGVHRLLDEADDIGDRNPGRAEAGGDVGGPQIRRLDLLKRRDVSGERRIEIGGRAGCRELGAHRTRKISVRRLPCAAFRIVENRIAELGEHGLDITMQKLRDVLRVGGAAFVEDDGERVDRRGDARRRRRRGPARGGGPPWGRNDGLNYQQHPGQTHTT